MIEPAACEAVARFLVDGDADRLSSTLAELPAPATVVSVVALAAYLAAEGRPEASTLLERAADLAEPARARMEAERARSQDHTRRVKGRFLAFCQRTEPNRAPRHDGALRPGIPLGSLLRDRAVPALERRRAEPPAAGTVRGSGHASRR